MAKKNITNKINKIDKEVDDTLYGDSNFTDMNDELDDIKKVIQHTKYKTNKLYGNNQLNSTEKLINRDLWELKDKIDNLNNNNKRNSKDTLNNLKNPDKNQINNMFFLENKRQKHYEDMKMITQLVPNLNRAVEIFYENITSPDDFQNKNLEFLLNDENISETNYDKSLLLRRLTNLESEYLDDDSKERLIKETLKLGDQFVAVIPLETKYE